MSKTKINKSKLEPQNDIDNHKVVELIDELDDEKPKKIINKTKIKLGQQNDVDDNNEIVASDEKMIKIKKKSGKKNSIKATDVDNTNSIVLTNKDITENNKNIYNDTKTEVKKFTIKDAKFKKEQNILFEKIKKIIDLTSANTFLSTTVVENNEKITGEILAEMKLYHHSRLWSQLHSTSTQGSMAIIRKIFMHHDFEIISKEFRSGEERGYKYYVVPIDKTSK